MRKHRLLTLLICCITAIASWAAVPFEVTTVTNGEFAAGTKWYTMKIHTSGFYFRYDSANAFLTLNDVNSQKADTDLWCFTGNATDGYKIYNKAAGARKRLASAANLADGNTGGNTYAHLMSEMEITADYVDTWDLTSSSNITGGFYIHHHGKSHTAAGLNKRGDKLAFWTGGADAGSTVVIESGEWVPSFSASPAPTAEGFVPSTVWYTMQLGSAGFVLSDNGEKSYIPLEKASTTLEDADLWCFVGDNESGYLIYNKQAGPNKVLASPAQISGDGVSAYSVLKALDGLTDGEKLWHVERSTDINDVNGCYLIKHGTSYAINNNGGNGKVAFWTGGRDQGSTFNIRFAETMQEISLLSGIFTASNAGKTWHSKWSSNALEGLTFGTGQNNMSTEGNHLALYTGAGGSCQWTITAPEDCVVKAYSFNFANHNSASDYTLTLTAGGKSYTTGAEAQSLSVENLEERTAMFTTAGGNKGVTVSDFYVTISRSLIEPEPQFEVFTTRPGDIVYRIPAIATAYNGDLIAVADYRHSGADIGMAHNGRIDLRARISHDNGATWDPIFPIIEGQGGAAPDSMHVAFGDPCIVADCESSRVMVLSCSGNVSFPNGTRTNHQGIARFYSEDNGKTWGEPVDISESIYTQFDKRAAGPIRCMFIGSGKISQSKTVKVGEYYRLYCAPLVKLGDGSNVNFVLYSDDFGGTWKVLGGVDVSPIPSSGDEPKADELPDGSVIISSRTSGGRIYNIYTFTNAATGEGSWGAAAWSNANNNGTVAVSNSTNGEIMFVPVQRASDGKKLYLALQSVPFGSGRANVGIYYKELESLADFVSPDSIAKDWDGHHQSSFMYSAYSTMTWQQNNTLGFLYEEETYGRAYTIVYKNYSIEQITDSAYAYCPTVDADSLVAASIDCKTASTLANVGRNVGQVSEEAVAEIEAALSAYKAQPSRANYEALNEVIAYSYIPLVEGKWYRLRNVMYDSKYMSPAVGKFVASNIDKADADQYFMFSAAGLDLWNLYNGNYEAYLAPNVALETQILTTSNQAEAAIYRITSAPNGRSALSCTNGKSHDGVHVPGDKSRLVPWTSGAEASQWYIEPVDTIAVTVPAAGWATLNLPFSVAIPEGVTVYATGERFIVNEVECLFISEVADAVPACTPVLLKAEAGTYTFLIPDFGWGRPINTSLTGMLKSGSVSGSNVYTIGENKLVKRSGSSGSMKANTAYYTAESEAAELPFTFEEGTPVGIVSVDADLKNAKFFDLSGRPVQKPAAGIYVTSDGRKVLVK